MPPPAKPNSNRFLQRSLHHQLENGQQSSPFFSRVTQDGATEIAAQAGKKRKLGFDDEASTPSVLPKQAVSANKRQSKDSQEKNHARFGNKRPSKSPAKQVAGGEHENLVQFDSSQTIQRSSADLDYEECRLHDRVSREEAGIFRSARDYGQAVEKMRRFGD